jgi:tetratricopeptide (TPR) repeat protein
MVNGAHRQKDLEARGRSAAALAAIFTLLAGASFGGVLPRTIGVISAFVALAALIAAWRFTVEARDAGVADVAAEEERKRTELLRRAPVTAVDAIDPTEIGVDAAAQDILPGGAVPDYVPRDVDGDLREAVEAALDGSGRWLVVVMGPSKVGKSRTLFQAVMTSARRRPLELVAPVDADALRATLGSVDEPAPGQTHTVLWLDDLEPFLNDGVTMATLREWRSRAPGGIVVGTYGGKGSERIAGSTSGGLATIAAEVLQRARQIPLEATTIGELGSLRTAVSAEQRASLERHGLAAYLVAAQTLETKLFTQRHAPGEPECPEGVAVVLAAVDWARCGRTDPIPHDTLRQLWTTYRPQNVVASDDAFDVALDWALRPVAGTIALLHRSSSYQAFDYVVRLVRDRQGAEPPRHAAWTAAIESADDAQALGVASAAYFGGRLEESASALDRARKSSVDELAALAGINLGVVLSDLGRSEEALGIYEDLVARYGEATEPAMREYVAIALFNKGVRLGDLDRPDDERGVYEEIVAHYGDATEPALRAQAAKALVNKGIRLSVLDRPEQAVGVYEEVVARYGGAIEPALREQVAKALISMGITHGMLDRSEEAVRVYDEVIARYGEATEPALREQTAKALLNKGVRLGVLDRPEQALDAYEEVVARYGDATEPAIREQVAEALFNKGVTLGVLDRPEDELGVYDEVVTRFGDATEPEPRKQAAKALLNKGVTLSSLDRNEEAVGVYEELIARYGDATEPVLRAYLAEALFNKGFTLGALARSEEAVGVYEEVVARFGDATEPALRVQIAKAMVNKGVRLGVLDRPDEELGAYEDVVARFGDASEPVLREQVAMALLNKGVTLGVLNRPEEAVGAYEEIVARYGDATEPALAEHVALARRALSLGASDT